MVNSCGEVEGLCCSFALGFEANCRVVVPSPFDLLLDEKVPCGYMGDLGAELLGQVTCVHQKIRCTVEKRHYQAEWAPEHPSVMSIHCKVWHDPWAGQDEREAGGAALLSQCRGLFDRAPEGRR